MRRILRVKAFQNVAHTARYMASGYKRMKNQLFKDNELVSSALARYFQMNGLPADGGFADTWARYKLGKFVFIAFPNFTHRVHAIARHDIHHIVNDLDASSKGEGLIAAWELASGCGKYWISWIMESQGLWFGIIFAPKETWKRFKIGRNSRNFFHQPYSPELLHKTVRELRVQLFPQTSMDLESRFVDLMVFILYAIFGILAMTLFFPMVAFFTAVDLISRFFIVVFRRRSHAI